MKRHEPDPAATVAALSRRIDGMDQRLTLLDSIDADVAALGRGLGDLTAQMKNLAEAATRRIFERPQRPNGSSTEQPEAAEQPNWLIVTDPTEAAQWLCDASAFAADVLPLLGRTALPGCWPLHPAAVAEVLAVQAQYRTAYTAPEPTPVSELLSRWLPGAVRRLTTETGACASDRAHQAGGRSYEIPRLDPNSVATWWAETHGTSPDAVEAFALTPIT